MKEKHTWCYQIRKAEMPVYRARFNWLRGCRWGVNTQDKDSNLLNLMLDSQTWLCFFQANWLFGLRKFSLPEIFILRKLCHGEYLMRLRYIFYTSLSLILYVIGACFDLSVLYRWCRDSGFKDRKKSYFKQNLAISRIQVSLARHTLTDGCLLLGCAFYRK